MSSSSGRAGRKARICLTCRLFRSFSLSQGHEVKCQLIGGLQTWWLKASLLLLLALRVRWSSAQVLQRVEDGVKLLQRLFVHTLHGG